MTGIGLLRREIVRVSEQNWSVLFSNKLLKKIDHAVNEAAVRYSNLFGGPLFIRTPGIYVAHICAYYCANFAVVSLSKSNFACRSMYAVQ